MTVGFAQEPRARAKSQRTRFKRTKTAGSRQHRPQPKAKKAKLKRPRITDKAQNKGYLSSTGRGVTSSQGSAFSTADSSPVQCSPPAATAVHNVPRLSPCCRQLRSTHGPRPSSVASFPRGALHGAQATGPQWLRSTKNVSNSPSHSFSLLFLAAAAGATAASATSSTASATANRLALARMAENKAVGKSEGECVCGKEKKKKIGKWNLPANFDDVAPSRFLLHLRKWQSCSKSRLRSAGAHSGHVRLGCSSTKPRI